MLRSLSREAKLAAAIYLVCLAVYCAVAGPRLRGPSSDTHFSYQAQMFLQRRLDLGHSPPNMNDWAEVEYLHLKSGRTVAGVFLRAQPSRFHQLGGRVETIDSADIVSRDKKYYVSFPPFPAVLFLPFVAIWGLRVNDVLLSAAIAALAPALLFLALRRLRARGDTESSRPSTSPSAQARLESREVDDLVVTGLFAFGTVYFYASVMGQVWYTAHVVATALTGLYVLAALDARHPWLAGTCIGALLLTRPHVAAWALLFAYEAWRTRAAGGLPRKLIAFALPAALLGALGFAFNYVRFHSFTEFGHFYLNVRWTDRIQRYGLENFAFLARNLTCAFTLTPKFLATRPYVQLSWHGMSMLITSPALLYLVWPRRKNALHTVLWTVVTPIALMGFLYQNDGWVQFGYRFSIDFLFALMLLLAIGGRPRTRLFYALVLWGVAINLFGALTFGRAWQFYFDGFFPIQPTDL